MGNRPDGHEVLKFFAGLAGKFFAGKVGNSFISMKDIYCISDSFLDNIVI